jgi:hypothetical protein
MLNFTKIRWKITELLDSKAETPCTNDKDTTKNIISLQMDVGLNTKFSIIWFQEFIYWKHLCSKM